MMAFTVQRLSCVLQVSPLLEVAGMHPRLVMEQKVRRGGTPTLTAWAAS